MECGTKANMPGTEGGWTDGWTRIRCSVPNTTDLTPFSLASMFPRGCASKRWSIKTSGVGFTSQGLLRLPDGRLALLPIDASVRASGAWV